MVVIAKKPGIRVQIHCKAGSLIRVSLFSASSFIFDTEFCDPSMIDKLTAWLKAYSQGKFLPYDLPFPPPSFREEVLRYLQTIPWGSVVSYQDVAKAAGSPRAARAVGSACRGNFFPLFIPCHRVIHSDGKIGCYTPQASLKETLLQFEGAI